ncbi:hypothetical protein MBLNU13_g06862t2 [Cladosporium sp. NU13]
MTDTVTRTSISIAETFTKIVSHTSTIISTVNSDSPSPTNGISSQHSVIVGISVEVPLTCETYGAYSDDLTGISPGANPDIAGVGILLAFFVTACAAVLLSLAAYIGDFLPSHYLRRVDRRIFRANSRNQDSRWRNIIEKVVISVSDQQLVTALAILAAGYYEIMNNNLSVYHWQIVVYLAWLSSVVHIESLTLLRDVFNNNPNLRSLRVAGILVLLALLEVTMWPTRFTAYSSVGNLGMPVRCWWKPTQMRSPNPLGVDLSHVVQSWVLTVVMLLLAYVWKLSQLFESSRGFVRRWLVAKPGAAIERLMRKAALSHRYGRLRWLTAINIHFVTYAEFAESFAASILYLCLALPYGITLIIGRRSSMDDEVIAGEQRPTFGQLVPPLFAGPADFTGVGTVTRCVRCVCDNEESAVRPTCNKTVARRPRGLGLFTHP